MLPVGSSGSIFHVYILCNPLKYQIKCHVFQNEVHDLRHNSSGIASSPRHKMYGESYGAEGLQEPFTPAQSYHGAPLTGQHTPSNQSRNTFKL